LKANLVKMSLERAPKRLLVLNGLQWQTLVLGLYRWCPRIPSKPRLFGTF